MNGNIPHIKGVGDIAGDAVSIRYDADRFCMSKNDNIQFLSSVAEKMAAITKPVKEINMREKIGAVSHAQSIACAQPPDLCRIQRET